jgi:PAS domain S-box-containing protein
MLLRMNRVPGCESGPVGFGPLRLFVLLLFAAMLAWLLLFPDVAAAQSLSKKDVLLLNSYRAGYSWTAEQVRGIESVLGSESYLVDVWVEYMDMARNTGSGYREELRNLYRAKYGRKKVDAIVSTDDEALAFLLDYHTELFPGTPVVFCGVNDLSLADRVPRDLFTGVIEVWNSREVLDTALRLHPGTRRVYVVTDRGPTAASLRRSYEEIAGLPKGVDTVFLDGRTLSFEEILEGLRRISDHSLVITTEFLEDKTGNYFRKDEALSAMVRATKAPFYSPYISDLVGRGLVAASKNGGFNHGGRAARLALRVLQGVHPGDIPVETDKESQLVFDFNEITRWGISESQLPANCVVLNRPSTFYQANKYAIWSGIAFILFQTVVIAGLFVTIAARRRAEVQLTKNAEALASSNQTLDLLNQSLRGEVQDRITAEVALRESEERLRLALDAAQMGTWSWDIPTGKVVWSENVAPLMGVADSRSLLSFDDYQSLIHPEDRASILKAIADCLARSAPGYQVEHRVIRPDGSLHWVGSKGQVYRDASGEPVKMAGTVWDITQPKQAAEEIRKLNAELEQRVKERTAQLEAANRELEAFSYSVSHDLRAPLTNIEGFVSLLGKAAESLDGKSLEYLTHITNSAKRMAQLIDDLLEFSRTGRAEMHQTVFGLDELVEESLGLLNHEVESREIVWKRGKLPRVRADRSLLRQVVVNLISNALKYSRKRERAEIEIGCIPDALDQGYVVCYVKDNGVGFDMKYVHRLFGVFQRLHRASEFEGTGIGLANVQRIIHRHGGRTWAEGKVDQGATIYFSLKSAPDA